MPEPRTRFAAALLNNQIWVVGGYDNVVGSGARTGRRAKRSLGLKNPMCLPRGYTWATAPGRKVLALDPRSCPLPRRAESGWLWTHDPALC